MAVPVFKRSAVDAALWSTLDVVGDNFVSHPAIAPPLIAKYDRR